MDYILYRIINNKGMNLGIRFEDGIYVPLTLLISKAINVEKYLANSTFKSVQKLEIIENNIIIEQLCYSLLVI